jgi:hypothetical protein
MNIAMIISFNFRASEAWGGPREGREGSQVERKSFAGRSEAWEGVTGESTGSKGLAGASKALEGPQVERESFADKNKAWEGLQESREIRESFIASVNSP